MGRDDPFTGYSFVLRTVIYVLIPAFAVWQFIRLKRALHVYQLESYKRQWFLRWVREDRRRALFLSSYEDAKKPLVMTGRAWRMLIAAAVLSVLAILMPSAAAHLLGGAPWDLITCALMFIVVFLGAPWLLLAGDIVMSPIQRVINGGYLRKATGRLREIGPVVIGVTGSFGKTSTKFAIQQLLGPPSEVLATPGSFNTTLGVSRTINERLQPGHRYFVVEMGARQGGDIAEIARFVHHKIGVLTAIGPAHLETFGSLEAIAKAKREIIDHLPPDGIAVVNVDDPEVRKIADSLTGVSVIRYGINEHSQADITVVDVALLDDGTALSIFDVRTGERLPVRTQLLGRHAIGHLLAAVAVALATGRKLAELAPRIGELKPAEHRLQIIKGSGGVTVIDDAYNSNPSGAEAALDVLARMPGNRKVLVTPGMVELGPLQFEANERFGEQAAAAADTLIFVAKLNRAALVSGAEKAGAADRVITVDSLAEATEKMKGLIAAGDVVLFENDLPDQYEG